MCHRLTAVAVDSSQQCYNCSRIGDSSVILRRAGCKGATQVCRDVSLSSTGRDGISEDLPNVSLSSMRSFVFPTSFNRTQRCQHIRQRNLMNRLRPDVRQDELSDHLRALLSTGASFFACSSSHSFATSSKVTSRAFLSACRRALGSIPSAIMRRASSRQIRARLSETSGYTPRDMPRSFPSYRYFNRHYRPPPGVTSKYSPPPSNNFNGFSTALAARISSSVNAIVQLPPRWAASPRVTPRVAPVRSRLSLDNRRTWWNKNAWKTRP